MNQEQIIKSIKKDLNKNVDLKYKKGATNYFKEQVKIMGVRSKDIRKISKKYFNEIKNQNKQFIFELAEKLVKTEIMECQTIAFNWLFRIRKQYQEDDFKFFEKILKKYVKNWATCDDFSSHIIGNFILMYPKYIEKVKIWTNSKNLWVRRASAVCFITPLRLKNIDQINIKDIFFIADALLTDEQDLVQKGYGWMLKNLSNTHQKQVFDFIMKNKKTMPRTALRYAIETMPKKLKKQAMA